MGIRAITVVTAASVLAYSAATAGARATKPSAYSRAVERVCAGALLFGHRHEIGTRAGAIAVSRDIRRTGNRRLRRVVAIPEPLSEAALAHTWIAVERRLVAMYAATYLRIWYVIERARTPGQRATLPARLRTLIALPRTLERTAARYGQRLNAPDCTGGTPIQALDPGTKGKR
jgi:hypothetical protein